MKMSLKKVGFAVFVAGLASVASAPAQAQNAMGNSAYLRVLHAVPKGPKVDIFVDSKKMIDDVAYSGDPTKYVRLPAGIHRFSVVENYPRRVLFTTTRRIRLDRFYTLAGVGAEKRPTFRLLDDTSGTTHPRRARLSLTHLSATTGPVDIVAHSKSLGRWVTLTRGLRYGQTRTFLVAPGPYEIFARSRGLVLKSIDGVNLQAGRRYAAYALGRVGASDSDNRFRLFLDVASSQ
jgi:hypothetical protein